MEEYVNILKQEKSEQELEDYKENEINWVDDDFYDDWDKKLKPHNKNILGHHETYDLDDKIEPFKKIFLAHFKDTIKGKAQLVMQNQITIPLIKEIIKKVDDEDGEGNKIKKNLHKYMFFDEKVDGRTEGYQRDSFQKDFRIYRVIDKEDRPYLIFSNDVLPNCSCEFKGMIMDMEASEELTRSFKIKGITKVFLLKDFIPSVKILTKEQIINFTKTRKIDENYWFDFLNYHPNRSFNRLVYEVKYLISSQILSGKLDNVPQNIIIFGLPGTNKSMGYLETIDYKFNESSNILEGGNSRIKMLTPSFKEKPANLGYLAKCERFGFVDEIGKMVEFEINKHQSIIQNILGECNFLLDNKERLVGSGNDNECKVQATAKFIKVTNPVSSKRDIYEHVGLIDPTYLSRNLIWVQDDKEKAFAQSRKSVEKIPPTPTDLYTKKDLKEIDINNINNINTFVSVRGNRITIREEFLTLFDTCNSFICELDEDKINSLIDEITILAKEPMKSSVWKPRAEHHVFLLIDGLVKHRCLFKDYDSSFTAKQEDYDLAERILIRMVKGWDTNLSPKEEFR